MRARVFETNVEKRNSQLEMETHLNNKWASTRFELTKEFLAVRCARCGASHGAILLHKPKMCEDCHEKRAHYGSQGGDRRARCAYSQFPMAPCLFWLALFLVGPGEVLRFYAGGFIVSAVLSRPFAALSPGCLCAAEIRPAAFLR